MSDHSQGRTDRRGSWTIALTIVGLPVLYVLSIVPVVIADGAGWLPVGWTKPIEAVYWPVVWYLEDPAHPGASWANIGVEKLYEFGERFQ